MKHLDVLDDAGLITRTKVGRTVTVQLRPEPIREAMDWLRRYALGLPIGEATVSALTAWISAPAGSV